MRRFGFAAFILLIMADMARAEMILPDPWQLIHIAREHGDAEVEPDSMREMKITGVIEGRAYEIGFYGCYLGRDCASALFQARFAREKWEPAPDDVAAWNAEKLFGRAWLGEDATAVLDHPVAMQGGLPRETVEATFAAWKTALEEYADFLDF